MQNADTIDLCELPAWSSPLERCNAPAEYMHYPTGILYCQNHRDVHERRSAVQPLAQAEKIDGQFTEL